LGWRGKKLKDPNKHTHPKRETNLLYHNLESSEKEIPIRVLKKQNKTKKLQPHTQ
jgi:hypothetical protein